jgi:adenylate cyclase
MPFVPTIQFTENDYGPEVSSDKPDGGRLHPIADEMEAPILFSCRDAKCGICRVEPLEGEDLMEPASPAENVLLKQFRAPPGHRLACQVIVKPGGGLLRLRWSGGDPAA